MHILPRALTALAILTCIPAHAAEVDFSDPAAVLGTVFEAARTGDTSALSTLCDPRGENDGDTQRYICDMAPASSDWGEFLSAFAKAKVAAPADIAGTTAKVPFLFGPDGTRQETMNLIQRDGKWYLSSF